MGSEDELFVDFEVVDSQLYFVASDGNHSELWTIKDPSPPQIRRVSEISSGPTLSTPLYPFSGPTLSYHDSAIFNNVLYIGDNSGLWSFDGQTSVLITDENLRAPYGLTVLNKKLYFFTDSGLPTLWSYDGSETTQIATFSNQTRLDPGPVRFAVLYETLYFAAGERTDLSGGPTALEDFHGKELWSYDGNQLRLAADINPGFDGSFPFGFTVFQNQLYFGAESQIGNVDLWRYDGTNATLVTDLNADSPDSNGGLGLYDLTVFQDRLIFRGHDNQQGVELWSYNGSEVSLISDINPGSGSSFPSQFVEFENNLYFSANDGDSGFELWQYDGNTVSQVADIYAESDGSLAYPLAVLDSHLYLGARRDGDINIELWQYDGESVSLVSDINPGPQGSIPFSPVMYGDRLYFGALDQSRNPQDDLLWVLDPNAPAVEPETDFGNDRKNDILWRNYSTGENRRWSLDGNTVVSDETFTFPISPQWQLATIGDFSGNGQPDVMWRNPKTGQNVLWFMEGDVPTHAEALPALSPDWTLVGSDDFNEDETDDLLWRKESDGSNRIWYITPDAIESDSRVTADQAYETQATEWELVATGTFNLDSTPDLIWYNTVTRSHEVWFMGGDMQIQSKLEFPLTVPEQWRIEGASDFDGDRNTDLLLRNTSTGANQIWRMNGLTRLEILELDAITDNAWQTIL